MQDRDEITGLIRQAVGEQAGLELVIVEGKLTPYGGYPVSCMHVQRDAATVLSIEVAWYIGAASFDLYGPAVDGPDDDSLWASRGLVRSREYCDHGRLQIHVFMPYDNDEQAANLLWLIPVLLRRVPQ